VGSSMKVYAIHWIGPLHLDSILLFTTMESVRSFPFKNEVTILCKSLLSWKPNS